MRSNIIRYYIDNYRNRSSVGNSPITGEFHAQRPVTWNFDVFFDLRLNKRLSKQSWGWWHETPLCPLWRHCNVLFHFRFTSRKIITSCSLRRYDLGTPCYCGVHNFLVPPSTLIPTTGRGPTLCCKDKRDGRWAKEELFNTLRQRQNGRHFPDDIFKCISLNENIWILIKISLKFFPEGPINNIPALILIMAWCQSGNKPLSESMMA